MGYIDAAELGQEGLMIPLDGEEWKRERRHRPLGGDDGALYWVLEQGKYWFGMKGLGQGRHVYYGHGRGRKWGCVEVCEEPEQLEMRHLLGKTPLKGVYSEKWW